MKKGIIIGLVGALVSLGAVCQTTTNSNSNASNTNFNENVSVTTNSRVNTNSVNTNSTTASSYIFTADAGVRQPDASNAGVKMNEQQTLTLLYENRDGNGGGHNTVEADESSDWLEFGNKKTGVDQDNFRAVQLPDGTWRAYGLDTTKGIIGTCLQSESSTDGVNFTPDEGCRYELQAGDNGRMGVYDFFNDQEGGVVMLYLGDLMGKNNVRRAYSTDNGWTFTFDQGNVFGDDDAGGGGKTYVDQKTVTLPDGSVYLVAMKSGSIYGFLSQDGKTFTPQGKILAPEDYTDVSLSSLHDPQIIRLPDGRLRIYLAGGYHKPGAVPGSGEGETWMIVSATSE